MLTNVTCRESTTREKDHFVVTDTSELWARPGWISGSAVQSSPCTCVHFPAISILIAVNSAGILFRRAYASRKATPQSLPLDLSGRQYTSHKRFRGRRSLYGHRVQWGKGTRCGKLNLYCGQRPCDPRKLHRQSVQWLKAKRDHMAYP